MSSSSNNSSSASLVTAATSPPRSRPPTPYLPAHSRPVAVDFWTPQDMFCVQDNPDDIGYPRTEDSYPTFAKISQRVDDARCPNNVEDWGDLWVSDQILAQSCVSSEEHHRYDFPCWMRNIMSTSPFGDPSNHITGCHFFGGPPLCDGQQEGGGPMRP